MDSLAGVPFLPAFDGTADFFDGAVDWGTVDDFAGFVGLSRLRGCCTGMCLGRILIKAEPLTRVSIENFKLKSDLGRDCLEEATLLMGQ